MINDSSEYFLHVLKCFIHRQKPDRFEGDVNELLRLSDIHFLKAVVGYMAINNPDIVEINNLPVLRKSTLSTIGYFANRAEFMKSLIGKMSEEGIDHLLFKGYVVKGYYPVPDLRSYGDIDFLIRKEDRKKSDELMLLMGYRRKNDWEPVYSYYRDTEYYEIHTEILEEDVSDKADYKSYFSHVWERAVLKDGHTYVLGEEDHIIYLIAHIAKHVKGSGAGIRMYLDIAVMLNSIKDRLDWEYLVSELKKIKLYDFAEVVFCISEKYFDVRVSDKLFKRNDFDEDCDCWNIDKIFLNRFISITLEGGVFGFNTRDAGVDTLKKAKESGNGVLRAGVFLRRLFPKASTIESRYTYLQNRHWLLPIAWVHRLIKTRGGWNYHVNEAKGIVKADEKKVREIRKMYERLGL